MRPGSRRDRLIRPMLAAVGLALAATAGAAETGKGGKATGGLLPGASSKEPVSVDAGKLDYFDKESKLVYTGSVVAKQGDSTLRASILTIYLNKEPKKAEGDASTAPQADVVGPSGSSIRSMDAKGPVTVTSKDEVGTGDNGSYDKAANRITLTGNVTLTQATNVIKGDKLVYDMNTGQAQVTSGQTAERVRSVFTPGSGAPSAPKKGKTLESATPRKPAAATP